MLLPISVLLMAGLVLYAGFSDISVTDAFRKLLGRAPKGKLGSLSGLPSGASGGSPGSGQAGSGSVIASLFPPGMKVTMSRHDQGRDMEGKAGSPVFSPGDGRVEQNGNNPGGFGISYPIVHFTSGPWAGHSVYFGHIQSAVHPGQQVHKGTILGHLGNGTGPYVGNATGISGHIEIGFWPPGGFGAPLPAGL